MKDIGILLGTLPTLLTLWVLWSAVRDAWSKPRGRQRTDPDYYYVGDIRDGGGDDFGSDDGGDFGGGDGGDFGGFDF